MLAEYMKDGRYDPLREIWKEKNLQQFFKEKKDIVNEFIENDDLEVKLANQHLSSKLKKVILEAKGKIPE